MHYTELQIRPGKKKAELHLSADRQEFRLAEEQVNVD